MKIWMRVSIVVLFLFAAAFYYFTTAEMGETKRRYREATEEPLVDLAHLLAKTVGANSTAEALNINLLSDAFADTRRLSAPARIYDLVKGTSDIEVYITDIAGKVLYDSGSPLLIGSDYSRWNDVYWTLKGEYGARSSVDETSGISTLYVAAPIHPNPSHSLRLPPTCGWPPQCTEDRPQQ